MARVVYTHARHRRTYSASVLWGCALSGARCPSRPPLLVLKNYFSANATSRQPAVPVRWFPLSVGDEFLRELGAAPGRFASPPRALGARPAAERPLLFSFAGSVQSNPRGRLRMVRVTRSQPMAQLAEERLGLRALVQFSALWDANYSAAAGYDGAREYRAVLGDSMFALVPGGHSPECFRLWEAIHAGAVPIVVFEDPLTGRKDAWFNCEDPLRPLLASGAPLVALDSWDDLYAFFDKFKTAFDLQAWVDVRQRRMRHWVQEFEAGAAARTLAALRRAADANRTAGRAAAAASPETAP